VEQKKTYLSLYISPNVKQALEQHAVREDRTLSNLCDRLLGWSAKWMERAGDSHTLMAWTASPRAGHANRRPTRRVSEELQEQLHAALDLMFERAPSVVIEKVAEFLTERAGKFGDEK
jgi:hypothetical protein